MGTGEKDAIRNLYSSFVTNVYRITKVSYTCPIRINSSTPYDPVSKLAPEYPSLRRTFPRALFYLSARALISRHLTSRSFFLGMERYIIFVGPINISADVSTPPPPMKINIPNKFSVITQLEKSLKTLMSHLFVSNYRNVVKNLKINNVLLLPNNNLIYEENFLLKQ